MEEKHTLLLFIKVVVSFDDTNVIADHLRLRFVEMWKSENEQRSQDFSVSTLGPYS